MGSPRSGTTLLKEVLNLNPKIFILNETDFVPLIANVIHNIGEANQGKEVIYKVIINTKLSVSLTQFLSNEKIFKLINQSEYNLFSMITSLYQEVLKITGATVVGDKSPNYISSANFFRHVGLFDTNTKYIHIVRDLRDVLLSIKKMSWAPKDLHSFSENWSNSNLKMSNLGSLYPENYFFMKYEDFVLEPEPILYKCCDFLGVKYDTSMMNWANCKKDVHDASIHQNIGLPPLKHRIENWRNELLNEPELLDYACSGNAALKFYGYSFSI
jgi:hypothetical protein